MNHYFINLFICALLFSNVIFGSSKRKSIEDEDLQNAPRAKKPSPTSVAHFFHDEQELPEQPLSTIYDAGSLSLEPTCTSISESPEFVPSFDDLFTDWWWLLYECNSSSSASSSSSAMIEEEEQDALLCIDSWNLDENNYMSFDEEQEYQNQQGGQPQQQQQGQEQEQKEQEEEEEKSVESSIDLFDSPDLDFD